MNLIATGAIANMHALLKYQVLNCIAAKKKEKKRHGSSYLDVEHCFSSFQKKTVPYFLYRSHVCGGEKKNPQNQQQQQQNSEPPATIRNRKQQHSPYS